MNVDTKTVINFFFADTDGKKEKYPRKNDKEGKEKTNKQADRQTDKKGLRESMDTSTITEDTKENNLNNETLMTNTGDIKEDKPSNKGRKREWKETCHYWHICKYGIKWNLAEMCRYEHIPEKW